MRLKNSSYNVFFNILQLMITTVLTFATRTFFIRYLGKEMLGLDGLFTNILSMLSLTDLGLGTAISFSLYKPLAEGDDNKVSCLMSLYKRIYRIVAALVLVIGLAIVPLLPYFSNGYTGNKLYIYYLLYLGNTIITYLLAYKETLIVADQHEHKLFFNRLLFSIIMYVSQIIILVKTHSFILYIFAMLLSTFLRNLINNIYITKTYNRVNFNTHDKMSKEEKNVIVQNTKNMFVSKIGDYLLNGTDNIIISAIDITLTGIYSNYLAIIGIMKTLINSIYNGVTASFGNVVATESKDVQERIFKISTFICFAISGLITMELIFLFNPFIRIWAGSDYTIEFWISIVIALNFYFYSNHISLNSIKIAAGQYKADRFVPIFQAIVNLIVSIVLGYYIGLAGVVLGTLISYLTVGFIFRPILLIKNIFNKSAVSYFCNQAKYMIVLFAIFGINILIFNFADFDSSMIMLVAKSLIVFINYIIVFFIAFNKDYSFNYTLSLIKKRISKE